MLLKSDLKILSTKLIVRTEVIEIHRDILEIHFTYITLQVQTLKCLKYQKRVFRYLSMYFNIDVY